MAKEYAIGSKAFEAASRKNKSILELHGDKFLADYGAMCRKHKIIVDSVIGSCNMRSATSREIDGHLTLLGQWLAVDLADTKKGSKVTQRDDM